MFLYERCKSDFLSDRDMEGNLDPTKLSRTVSHAIVYGHSLPGKVLKMSVQPPAILFHGTSLRS
jgi:hypothetical protein